MVFGTAAGWLMTESVGITVLSGFAALGALGLTLFIGGLIDEVLRKHYRRV
jgi:hypothetical protein